MRRIQFCCIICLLLFASVARPFEYQDVIAKAKSLAEIDYQEPPLVPKFLRELKYGEYQNIRFNPEKSLWRESASRFQVMLICPGLFFTHSVGINIVDGSSVERLPFKRESFTFGEGGLEKRIPPDLGYAGFKLTYPLKEDGGQNQFMVFAGASYFRGVGKDNAFGLSARGLALDTGLPAGEEFPSFVEYWLVRPAPNDNTMVVYALLDSRSVTGAYALTITPGTNTSVAVKATIFPRDTMNLPGIAPLTSMFYYGENTGRPRGEWRRQVHDSDGLLVHDGTSGEWLWRPVLNPKYLTMDYFLTENVRGFGLLQRDKEFNNYLDAEAQYHLRPSGWVEPEGEWGKGQVVLIQLPSPDETNDNIVAFWSPAAKFSPGQQAAFAYTLKFGNDSMSGMPMGKTIHTMVGDGNRIGGGSSPGAYRFVVDFAGGRLDAMTADADVTASVTAQEDGEVIDYYVEYVQAKKCWRLSVLAQPAEKKPLLLRAFLSTGTDALTETWTYRLEAENDINGN